MDGRPPGAWSLLVFRPAGGRQGGYFDGVPTYIKDNVDVEGMPTMQGTDAWEPRLHERHGDFARFFLATGLIALGKTQLSEFGFSASAEHPRIGAVRNPWDTDCTAGASSSGSGAFVASGVVPIAHANDGGGSIRVPASCNGLVGLKVTFGRISLHGTALLSWTLDSIGPLGRSVDDCAEILRALSGADARDPTTLDQPALDLPAQLRAERLDGLRIALPDAGQLPTFMHPAVLAAWRDSARRLERLGAAVVPVRLPEWYFELSRPAGVIIASSLRGRPAARQRRSAKR